MITFRFPGFVLEWDAHSGECFTRYPSGKSSGCGLVDGDYHHAPRLGITPEEHRVQHELAHHLVGYALYGYDGSPVIRRAALGIPQEEGGFWKPGWSEAAREEWICEMVQYRSLGKGYTHDALTHAEQSGMDVHAVCVELGRLMIYAHTFTDYPYPVDITARPPRKE